MKDPIVEEVREARRKHAERFNFDLHAVCLDVRKKEMECGHDVWGNVFHVLGSAAFVTALV